MWFCLLFPHLPGRRSRHGLYKFVPVPDLQEGLEDMDVNHVTAAVLAAAEDLVGDGDDAVHGDGAAHPVIAPSVLEGLQVKFGRGHVVAASEEARRRRRHLQTLVRSLGVIAHDPFVELSLGDVQ